MRRARALLLLGLVITVAVTTAAGGRAGQPVLRHPNPLATQITLDYQSPIPAPGGGWAWLVPLDPAIINASVVDLHFLEYEKLGDLGGFVPAPIHGFALGTTKNSSGVTCMHGACTGVGEGKTQIVLYTKNAQQNNKINSYTPLHGLPTGVVGGPHNCVQCVPVIQPNPGLFSGGGAPPASGCFSGCSTGNTSTGKKHKHQHGNGKGGNGGGSGGGNGNKGGGGIKSTGDCGTKGLSINSDLRHCRIYVVNQAPGDSTFEHDVITNTSKSRYVLYIKATGSQNHLWNDLEMGIWKGGTAPPSTMPALSEWTHGYTKLAVLKPGQQIHVTIELALPSFAGNADQHLAAIVAFNWRAIGINKK